MWITYDGITPHPHPIPNPPPTPFSWRQYGRRDWKASTFFLLFIRCFNLVIWILVEGKGGSFGGSISSRVLMSGTVGSFYFIYFYLILCLFIYLLVVLTFLFLFNFFSLFSVCYFLSFFFVLLLSVILFLNFINCLFCFYFCLIFFLLLYLFSPSFSFLTLSRI